MATATDQRLSEQVSDAARRLGLTQTALAAMAGISDTAFSRRMNGRAKWTLSEVATLARVLELDLHALLLEERARFAHRPGPPDRVKGI